MEVILLKHYKKLGKVGDTVKVKVGFGRNFLLPQQIAIRATKENREKFAKMKEEIQKNSLDLLKVAESQVAKLNEQICTFIKKASDDGRLFGSVSKKDIAESLSAAYEIDLKYYNINLQHPIKYTGIHKIEVLIHALASPANIFVNVAKTQLESDQFLLTLKSPPAKETDTVEDASKDME